MSAGLLASLRVLDLGGAESDGVSRLFADLGADVLKVEPPGGSVARRAHAYRRGREHRVRDAEREQAQRGARSGDSRRPAAAHRVGRRPQTSSWTAGIPGAAGRIRDVVRGAGRAVRSPGRVVGHRLRHRGSVRVEAGHRRRVRMRCRPRCRGPGRRPARPCCHPTAWRRQRRRRRPRGRRWPPTITDCVAAEAITSTSPVSRAFCRRWTRRTGRRGRRRSA